MEKVMIEVQHLWFSVSLFVLIVFLLHDVRAFRKAISEQVTSVRSKLILITVFSVISIFGTIFGIPVGEGIINTRAAGVIAGGLLGGPVVGAVTGAVAGIHRYFYVDTFATSASACITFLQGVLAGLLSLHIRKRKPFWAWAFFTGCCLEVMHMLLFFVLAEPWERVVRLVSELVPSTVIVNAVGVLLFTSLLDHFAADREKAVSHAARSSFRSVSLLMDVMRSGLSAKNIQNVTPIIMNFMPELDWAAILVNGRLQALTVRSWLSTGKARMEAEYLAQTGEGSRGADTLVSEVFEEFHGVLIVRKSRGEPFNAYEKEMVKGFTATMKTVIDFHRLKRKEAMYSVAEIKVLQAQINPHFLFNALNTIGYYCRSDPKEARKLVLYLADYYRQNLTAPDTMIPLAQEMKHVRAYISLEQARFEERLRVEYRIEEDGFSVPALILQPLIENAILHGILPRPCGGTVRLSVRARGAFYHVSVLDDGVGMSREKCATLLDRRQRRRSIGLINVHRRLIFIYGRECGLRIRSREGRGTLVAFRIPRREEETAPPPSLPFAERP